MGRTIYINVSDLNNSFERMVDEMTHTYHNTRYNTPSKIQTYPEHDKGQGNPNELPSGNDPNWVNGLPRNGHAVSNGKIK